MVVFLVVLFFVLMVGGVLVGYAVASKNKWGINLNPVSCPRCKTSLPRLREPRSLRQAMLGGWTCPVGGAGVDRRGREVAPNAPRTIVKSEDEMWRVTKKRIILGAPLIFCLFMLFDWLRIAHARLTSNWDVVLLEVGVNIIWTLFFTATSLFLLRSVCKRIHSKDKGVNPRDGTDRTERVDRDST